MKRSRVDSAFPSNSGIDHVGIVTDSDLEPGAQRTYTNAIWQGETRGFPVCRSGDAERGIHARGSW